MNEGRTGAGHLKETAKLNAVDSYSWPADTLDRIPNYKMSKV